MARVFPNVHATIRTGGFLPNIATNGLAKSNLSTPRARQRLLLAMAFLVGSAEADLSRPAVYSRPMATDAAAAPAGEWLAPGKPTLTLEAADQMASAAISECKSKGFKDISVFVLDAAGRTLVSKTMVNVPNLIPTLAEAKAGACIGTHTSSRALKEKYVPDRTPQLLAMTMLGATTQQPFAAVPGGVLCRAADTGTVIGAIGCSGASADEDEHCALAGAHSCGFETEPAQSALQ